MTNAEQSEFFRGCAAVTDETLAEWIRCSRSGKEGADGFSTFVIRDFISRASLGKPQSKVTLEWLADALERVLRFEDARTALALPKRGKHRPAGAGILKAIDVVRWTALTKERGYSEKEAVGLAATLFACDERSVQRMRNQANGWDEGMSPDAPWEARFLEKRRPLPPRKMPDAK